MKTIFAILMLVQIAKAAVLPPPPASAVVLPPGATISWSACSNAAGYAVYYGMLPMLYDHRLDAGTNLSANLCGLNYGQTYYFAVTEINPAGMESDLSNQVPFIVPKILEMCFDFAGDHLLSSTDLIHWSTCEAWFASNAWRVVIAPAAGPIFFRTGGISE